MKYSLINAPKARQLITAAIMLTGGLIAQVSASEPCDVTPFDATRCPQNATIPGNREWCAGFWRISVHNGNQCNGYSLCKSQDRWKRGGSYTFRTKSGIQGCQHALRDIGRLSCAQNRNFINTFNGVTGQILFNRDTSGPSIKDSLLEGCNQALRRR